MFVCCKPLSVWAMAAALGLVPASRVEAQVKPPESLAVPQAKAPAKIDLNSATVAQLQQLPGIDRNWARRIIASRPYHSPSELSKAGIGPKTIARFTPLVTAVMTQSQLSANGPVGRFGPRLPPRPSIIKVDLNSATVEEIQALPGMDPGMAAHILAGRPYRLMEDLDRIGVPFTLVDKIRPYVTLGP
jgi:competence protein ComEA